MPELGSLLLVRHGESTANAAGLFTGILDVGLTELGFAEARAAAHLIEAAHFRVDVVYISELVRTRQTAETILNVLNSDPQLWSDWRLNERNYGALTGRSKHDTLAEYGEPIYLRWRRSVNVAPPPMPDNQFEALAQTLPFSALPAAALSRTESLADVIDRVRLFYTHRVVPKLLLGANVLIVGHGNSLRALCAELDQLEPAAIEALNIPTGQPLLYEFDQTLTPTRRPNRYLDPETALAAAIVIAHQGGT